MINLDHVPKDLRNNTKDLVRACYLLFIPQITKRFRIERKMYVSSFKSIVSFKDSGYPSTIPQGLLF